MVMCCGEDYLTILVKRDLVLVNVVNLIYVLDNNLQQSKTYINAK